jgi:type VI secretion system protein ImpC
MSDDSWTPNFGSLDAPAPAWAPKRPVRIAVLGDFSAGAASGRLDTGADLARRKMISVEFDNLEDTLARLEVKLNLPIGDGGAGVEVEFNDLDAFHPDTLYRELPIFKALADLRKRLNNTATFAKAATEVQSWAGGKRVSRGGKRRSRSGAPAADAKLSDFARLIGVAPDVITDGPVDALLKRIVGPFVVKAPDPKKEALTATVDQALSDAMRAVLHQPEFQNLESLWRGMDMLLRRIETGPMLQVLLVDISAEEFAADLSSVDDLSESGLYSMLVDKPSQEKNGGVSLICGLYQFEATPPHAELLGRMAKIAAQAGAPFITSMAPDALMERRKEPHPLVTQALEELRALPEASHLGLLAPRFMLRYPYGKRSDPISAFGFEEFTANDGLRGMLWGHPAIIAACVLAAPTGKTLSIGDLPFYYFVDADGDQVALPCTERLINADTAGRLGRNGIVGLMAHKGQPELRLAGLDSVGGSQFALQGIAKATTARMGVTTSLSSRPGGKESAVAAAASGDDDAGSDDDALSSSSDDDSGGDSGAGSSDESSSSDTSLDDLLASLSDDSPGDSGSSDAAGGDDASGDESPSSGEEEMDPELAALLKSLE